MSGKTQWDAVIVGGGPAGSAMAIRLARLGHSVLLVDRDEFPRPKPCGECLSPAAVGELRALGILASVQALPHERLIGWRISAPSGHAFDGSFPAPHHGIAIQRSVLDALLLNEAKTAGAEVRCGERVGDLLWSHGSVTGVRLGAGRAAEEINARLVVGADGLRSVVVRRLGHLRRAPRLKKLALTAHMSGPVDPRERGELHILANGCIGAAGVGDGLTNVTVVVNAESVGSAIAGARDAYFDALVARHDRFGGWQREDEVLATGPFDWPVHSAVSDGAMLVGDAAGYFDPFTGQGVYRALKGAALAAEHAHRALEQGSTSARALAGYDRAHRSAFNPGARLQRAIEAVVSREVLIEIASRGLGFAPSLADALVAVTADLRPVRSLLDPRLLGRLKSNGRH
ncbi:NAD(P)/FAD-dependent oxidoreductase [soil metagenome]